MKKNKTNSILAVDDESINLAMLKHILSSEYNVYLSTNGADAVEAAEELLPDLILLDVIMADTDGYAVIGELKKSEKTKDIPVIFLTALKDIENEQRGLALGASDYIIKPFSPDIVKLRVSNQIKMRDQARLIDLLSNQIRELHYALGKERAFKLSDAPFSFKSMIKIVLAKTGYSAYKKKQLIDFDVEPLLPFDFAGDEKRLAQVITVLLSNAIKFTPEQGEITFSGDVLDEDDQSVMIQIEVTGNGADISAELSAAKRIAEMMGGDIRVESEPGKGSKFTFACRLQKISNKKRLDK